MGPEPSTSSAAQAHIDRTPVHRPRRWLAWLLLSLMVAAIAALIWYVTAGKPSPGEGAGMPRGRPPATVGVAVVSRASFPVQLDALGTVTPVATATVRAQVSGVLQQVLFSEGQMVSRGQLLAVIDPRPFEIALMQARGQLQRDEAQLDVARVNERRYRQLLAQDSIARQEVDAQVALVKQLEGTVAIDRAAVRSAELNLDYSRITAPVAGRIGLRSIDVGNLVGPSDTAGLVAITQLDPIDVVFALPQDTVPELRKALTGGKPLAVTTYDRTRSTPVATGRFLALDNLVDAQTGTVRAKARFENTKQQLFPNQFVNVRLKLRDINDAIAVPVSAVRNGGDGPFVYVLDPTTSTVALRRVERGLSTPDLTQILSGLEPGEQVITEGADRLTDGASVRLPGTSLLREGDGQRSGGERSEPRRSTSGG